MSKHSVRWRQTDKHVYGAILREHRSELEVFSAFSNPEPSDLSGIPTMMTEWGFRNADAPLIKSEGTWEHGSKADTERWEYWIAEVHHEQE